MILAVPFANERTIEQALFATMTMTFDATYYIFVVSMFYCSHYLENCHKKK